jgi:type II secretory pathway pseudopilin PulG
MFHNQIKHKLGTSGFSLPGVLVGVALIGISATIISQTVINSRRTQKAAELKLTSNKFQQAAVDAVTERTKEFVLENCSGERWGGSGSDVEKAFRELPLMTDTGDVTRLRFTNSAASLDGHADVKSRCQNSIGPGVMGSGQYISFCMQIETCKDGICRAPGHPQIDYRLLELLIVPVNLASDQAIKCSEARGAAAGVKITWQMYTQMDDKKVSGSGSGKTVMKESGVFLTSSADDPDSKCKITVDRQKDVFGEYTDQCLVSVSDLLRPPKLFRDSVAVVPLNWVRSAGVYSFTTLCKSDAPTQYVAQSYSGTATCEFTEPIAPCDPGIARLRSSIAQKSKVGNDVIYKFLASDPAAQVVCPGRARILLVGGGGAAGSAAGGGGGGMTEITSVNLTSGVTPVFVGVGGKHYYTYSGPSNGGTTSFSTWSVLGGGAGGTHCNDLYWNPVGCQASFNSGQAGGSGGGASFNYFANYAHNYYGGAGTPGQGFSGGNSQMGNPRIGPKEFRTSGGGGGAGGAANQMYGGPGKFSNISGTDTCYAGGGGASNSCTNECFSQVGGSTAGCGGGFYSEGVPGTGGGGGGPGYSGGSGIVIIRVISSPPS